EWFPSVSATTGDWYPERAVFQIFIALASVFLWFLLITKSRPTGSPGFAKFLLIVGIIRTVSCGGWVYITSSDDHDMHDIAMITYLVCTLPWMFGVLSTTPPTSYNTSLKYRRWFCIAFFSTLVPMIYFFIQHKVQKVKTAYTYYAFFEWSLILYDVAFDAITSFDFKNFQLAIIDVSGMSSIAESHAGNANVENESSLIKFVRVFTEVRSFIADIYLAFTFWSMLTALALLIWYFPLWYMGISGYEVFLLVTVTPGFLAFDFVRKIVFKYRGFFHLLSLTGIASYTLKDPIYRLMASAFGIGISLLTWFGTWFGNRMKSVQLEYDISVWCIGLLLHNVVKMAWYSNNPIWPIMHEFNGGKNLIGLLLGILVCLELIIRDFNEKKNKLLEKSPVIFPLVKKNWVSASLGLGAIMFGLHSMFTDSSTIMRWVVDGYPTYGPNPISSGPVTISAMGVGLLISTNTRLSTSYLLYVIGCISCVIIYFVPAWIGYYAGLVLGAYFMAIVPYLIRSAILHTPGRTIFTAMMVYNIFCLAHVWVVAYEFVPGGPLARERTNWILIFMMAFIGLGIRKAASIVENYKISQLKKIRSIRNFIRIAIFVIIFLSYLVSFARHTSAKVPVPHRPEHKMFTAGIWTIHFTLDNDMWSSEVRIRDAIRDLEFDVIGLLESDTQRIIMGNRDLWQYISEDLGYYVDY
ncbi:11934_t:CDS:2, partial [Dentiscutata erythropus]